MPKQSPLRLIKRWRRYEPRGIWAYLPHLTRGIYILYKQEGAGRADSRKRKKIFKVIYIGVAGVAKEPKSGIGGRLRQHDKSWGAGEWTHYSFFEVHDNVSREEILELENFLLAIFRHDPRIELANKQKSSEQLGQLRKKGAWPEVSIH